MSRVLVLHAHPSPSRSRVNVRLADAARRIEGVTLVDLYAACPRFKIDVDAEQARLVEHDVVVFQCPFQWYSVPSLLKEWMDAVLEFGFAYGEGGNALAGKTLLVAITAGGAESAYAETGRNHFPIRTLLTPLEQTALLCGMRFLPPFVLFAALRAVEDGRADAHVDAWRALLEALRDDALDVAALAGRDRLSGAALPLLEGRGSGRDAAAPGEAGAAR